MLKEIHRVHIDKYTTKIYTQLAKRNEWKGKIGRKEGKKETEKVDSSRENVEKYTVVCDI